MKILINVLEWDDKKRKSAFGVLNDKKIHVELKGKIYRMTARPALLYGLQCWSIKKTQVHRLMVAKGRMIH